MLIFRRMKTFIVSIKTETTRFFEVQADKAKDAFREIEFYWRQNLVGVETTHKIANISPKKEDI